MWIGIIYSTLNENAASVHFDIQLCQLKLTGFVSVFLEVIEALKRMKRVPRFDILVYGCVDVFSNPAHGLASESMTFV